MNFPINLATICLYITLANCYIIDPGPRYPATKGEIWPQPKNQTKSDEFFVLKPSNFEFKLTTSSGKCKLLEDAIERYKDIISSTHLIVKKMRKTLDLQGRKKTWLTNENFKGNINVLDVTLNGPCGTKDFPTEDSSENYSIQIGAKRNVLSSDSVWGVIRGLESFYQSIYLADDNLSLRINRTIIEDSPRYSYRGLLLDTSRHFIPLEKIQLTIDAMAQNKLNVFHWHIVDDQSFPYVSEVFPELSASAAYAPVYTYKPDQIKDIIEYARVRGVRVIPEFDSPGHTRSWGVSHPELLTACEGAYALKLGPMNPARNGTFEFIEKLFGEVKGVFADDYIHLGGDEVGFECWQSSSEINDFMKTLNITDNYEALESYYIQKVINLVDKLNYKSIVWEEVFNNGVIIPNATIVHVWKDDWRDTMLHATSSGHHAILSSCWYLDHLESGGDWFSFYECEPNTFSNDPKLRSMVVGGEACMWAEVVDANNVISRIWPRASATAERLWSFVDDDKVEEDELRRRLEEHTCRMNRRGVGAQPPNGPGFCLL
ncbi:unnamed protein product [Phyllotreta striolata]|uniref:Beta-hexosaminidase n=1 Tax=Phyllotreta striolata TaxID=444603 RepID=A0A9N9TIC0_PHYSR|nr:unnamed protein product [Phyllotreta striolata]